MNFFEYDIQNIKGVGEKKARLLGKLGIFVVCDLICFFPRCYEDWSNTKSVSDSANDEPVCIKATMITPVKEHMIRRGMTLYKCNFSDGQCVIHVTIFNNKYLAESLRIYTDYLLFGKLEKTLTYASMSAPKIEIADQTQLIHPIYSATENLNSLAISKIMREALNSIDSIPETLSDELRDKYDLVPLDFAIRQIHFPTDMQEMKKAKKRLIFEELLVLSLGLMKLKGRKKVKALCVLKEDFSEPFFKTLPFFLTNAQKRAAKECINDMRSGYSMNRLLQGDVGSGKTAVAAALIDSVVKNGYQCALMAPTEILAIQHFETLSKLFEGSDITLCLLTGSTKTAEKKKIKKALSEGGIHIAIGTHALIQNDVEFSNLGLVITDEQHRFGVEQRANLAAKGESVHTLVMSATPIPRTLALIIYGDLDISVLDELPPGRQEVRTDLVDSRYNKRILKFLREAIDRGEQGYIICPLIEEGESDLLAATEYAKELSSTELKGYNIGLLHGKMKPKEKEAIMKSFALGDVKVLISTTVVEVGIDVPNATIMIIENAGRFGLSQLHQLRGRIGRGDKKSYCILVTDIKNGHSPERLNILKNSCDGFKIADEDLKLRGPGDFFGKRQHGLPELKIADMTENIDIMRKSRECAECILKDDYNLDKPENRALCAAIYKMFSDATN